MNFSSVFVKDNHDKFLINYLRNVFGFRPKNLEIYKMAFTHKSFSDNDAASAYDNNERLEYLGDAVLSAIVADFLFKKYPFNAEGPLTEMRSKLVSRNRLNALAQKIGLSGFILMNDHVHNKSAGGNAFEALLGAIYLDKGYEKTRKIVINNILLTHLDIDAIYLEENNFKSKILSWAQKYHHNIAFNVTEEPNHTKKKLYKVIVTLDEKEMGTGYGYTIKQAEQDAAQNGWNNPAFSTMDCE